MTGTLYFKNGHTEPIIHYRIYSDYDVWFVTVDERDEIHQFRYTIEPDEIQLNNANITSIKTENHVFYEELWNNRSVNRYDIDRIELKED